MLDLDVATLAAIAKNIQNPVDFVELKVDPDEPGKDVRFTSLPFNLFTLGNIWYGAGGLLSVGRISNTSEAKSNTIDIGFWGFDASIIELMDNNEINSAKVTIYKGFLDTTTGQLVSAPFQRWAGYVNNYAYNRSFTEDGNSIVGVSMSCESLLSVILGSKNARTTNDVEFSAENNGDRSMAYVAALSQWSPDFGKDRES